MLVATGGTLEGDEQKTSGHAAGAACSAAVSGARCMTPGHTGGLLSEMGLICRVRSG